MWQCPAELPPLEDDEVHIWRASLDLEVTRLKRLQQILSKDEEARAGRFRFQKDRDRFIVSRGLLRTLLGRYLCVEPRLIRFSYGPWGKPSLVVGSDGGGLQFNLSHSGGMALYAVTRDHRVGVDIEHVRVDFAPEEVAGLFLSPGQMAEFSSLPKVIQRELFPAWWTCKEAYLKARGEGLTLPLDKFDISFAGGGWGEIVATGGDPEGTSRWRLQNLAVCPGYVGALAMEGCSWRGRCWQWPQ